MYAIPHVIHRMLTADTASPYVLLSALPSSPFFTSPTTPEANGEPFPFPPSPQVLSCDKVMAETTVGDGGPSVDTTASMKLVYDVMRTSHGKVLFKPPHLNRIAHSLSIATGTIWYHRPTSPVEDRERGKWSIDVIEEALESYLRHPDVKGLAVAAECNLKFVAWPLAPNPGFMIFYIQSFFPPLEWYHGGIRVGLLHDAVRHDPSAKVVQAGLRTRALQLQKALDAYEVLLVNPAAQGFLVPEGSKSNYLLLTKDRRLLCSATEDILLGVTLVSVKEAAERAGLGVVVHQKLRLRDVFDAQSVIVLGTSPGTLPVKEIVVYRNEAEREQVETALRVDGVTLADYEASLCRSQSEGQNAGEAQTVLLPKEPRNECVDRLLAAYEELSMLSYH